MLLFFFFLQKFGHKEEDEYEVFFATTKMLWNNLEMEGRFKVPYKMMPGLREFLT